VGGGGPRAGTAGINIGRSGSGETPKR
jgi:hypothetical protein